MAFATAEDVATRLGRDLSAVETGTVEYLIELATGEIAVAVGRDDAWAAALTPVPKKLEGLVVTMVCRAFANPNGITTSSEQLGAYSYTQGFGRDGGPALMLTKAEELNAREAVWGRTTDSSTVESIADDLLVPEVP